MYKIQTPDDFLSTPWRMTIFDSCVMRLQTIGEYVKKIDDKTNKQLLPKYPQVPWVKVIGQRNIISHEYSAVDEEKIFITIKKHLPPLKSTVLLIIKDIEKDLDSQSYFLCYILLISFLSSDVCFPLHLQ